MEQFEAGKFEARKQGATGDGVAIFDILTIDV
jgi:hypothetical protein